MSRLNEQTSNADRYTTRIRGRLTKQYAKKSGLIYDEHSQNDNSLETLEQIFYGQATAGRKSSTRCRPFFYTGLPNLWGDLEAAQSAILGEYLLALSMGPSSPEGNAYEAARNVQLGIVDRQLLLFEECRGTIKHVGSDFVSIRFEVGDEDYVDQMYRLGSGDRHHPPTRGEAVRAYIFVVSADEDIGLGASRSELDLAEKYTSNRQTLDDPKQL